jgi:hypothetical protein
MSTFKVTLQDGSVTEFPMPASGWVRVDVWAGGAEKLGTYSSSELKSLEFPAWIAPEPQAPPRLKEVEFDQSIYDSNGNRVGPKVSFRALQYDDEPEPEPPAKPRRRPKIHPPPTKGAA